MNKNLKSKIIVHLLKKGNYDPDVDDYVIDMLIENIEFSETLKEDIITNGLVQSVIGRNGASYTKMNPSFGCYQMALRNINQCSLRLGINRKDRILLKIAEEKTIDEFANDFNI